MCLVKAGRRLQPGWIRVVGVVIALIVWKILAYRLEDAAIVWSAVAVGMVVAGAVAWEVIPAARGRQGTVTRGGAVCSWVRGQSRQLAFLGMLALGMLAVVGLSALG